VSSEIERKDEITRREFTIESVMALLAGVTITVTGCGGDDDPTPTSPSPTPSANVPGAVATNHGHTAEVTAAQITAAGAVSLDITGTATHPHRVELTGDEVRRIGQRQQVVKTSSTDAGHSHSVTFN
jgi:hypothetical protein